LEDAVTDIRIKMEMVVNKCYGGYSLSRKAQVLLAERKGMTLVEEDGWLYADLDTYDLIYNIVPRNDPDLVEVVRELGDEANGECAKLKIVTIDIGVDLDNRDGIETVRVSGGVY
jgi:hypothetical protein